MSKTSPSSGWMVAMAILSSKLAFGADIVFTGVSGSHWVTPSNWQNGVYPANCDTAFLDAAASLDTPSPSDLQVIKVGTLGTGIMHVTFDGSLAAAAVNSVSQIGSGTNNHGTVEQTIGSIVVNALEIGSNSATGTYNLNRGTLNVARRGQNNSIYLGSTSGGTGIFEVQGSDSAQIGTGSTNYINGGTFTVMECEGDLTDNGLQFAPSVDPNIWSFNRDTTNKKLTITAAGSRFVRQFAHPGGRHKLSDLERMRDMLAAGVEPWSSSFADLDGSGRGRYTYTVATAGVPLTALDGSTYSNFRNDCMASYHNSLMWFITGDNRHADKTIEILNTWSGLTNASKSIRA